MTRTLGLLALVVSLVASYGLAATAAAQEDPNERARLHFESGRSYFEEGAYERALQEFQRAYELSPLTPMLFNLGTTYERLGRLTEAADAFERFLRESDANLPNRSTLERRVVNLRRRAAQEAAAAEGQPPPEDPDPIDGQGATGQPASSSTSGGGDGGDGLILGGVVALSVAGAALISTGIFGGLTLSEQSAITQPGACGATTSCQESDISDLRTFATVTDVSWIVASVAGAAGLVLLVLGVVSGGDDDAQASVRFTGNGVEGSF